MFLFNQRKLRDSEKETSFCPHMQHFILNEMILQELVSEKIILFCILVEIKHTFKKNPKVWCYDIILLVVYASLFVLAY